MFWVRVRCRRQLRGIRYREYYDNSSIPGATILLWFAGRSRGRPYIGIFRNGKMGDRVLCFHANTGQVVSEMNSLNFAVAAGLPDWKLFAVWITRLKEVKQIVLHQSG